MDQQRRARRGRPKVPWDPFDDELHRRFTTGEASDTLESEARYLANWGAINNIRVPGDSEPIKKGRIRERIRKRHGGAARYKEVRQHHIRELIRKAQNAD